MCTWCSLHFYLNIYSIAWFRAAATWNNSHNYPFGYPFVAEKKKRKCLQQIPKKIQTHFRMTHTTRIVMITKNSSTPTIAKIMARIFSVQKRKTAGMIIFYCNTSKTKQNNVDCDEWKKKMKTKFEMKAFFLLVSFCRVIVESTAKWSLLGSQLDMFR